MRPLGEEAAIGIVWLAIGIGRISDRCIARTKVRAGRRRLPCRCRHVGRPHAGNFICHPGGAQDHSVLSSHTRGNEAVVKSGGSVRQSHMHSDTRNACVE